MQRIFTRGFIVVVAATAVAGAQSRSDAAVRAALVFTAVGALPPFATSAIQGEAQRGAALGLRYGYLSAPNEFTSENNFGISALLPFGSGSTLTLTGGLFSPSCDRCDLGLMLAIGADRALGDVPMSSNRDAARLRFALNGELGYGQQSGATLSNGSVVSGSVGIPISLVSGSRVRNEMRIVPFITPAFGFGGIRGGDSPSGSALMIGGGIGIYNRSSSVALSFGFQHVAVEDAGTLFGLALVLGGR
jgi:hypothetical protein